MEYIIDSYAWIEYFLGSLKGDTLKNLFLDERNIFYTLECCLAEIRGWTLRENEDFDRLFNIISANSELISLTKINWIDAGKKRHEQRNIQKDFGLIDAMILVKQAELKCKIISGDAHFKNLKNVIFLG